MKNVALLCMVVAVVCLCMGCAGLTRLITTTTTTTTTTTVKIPPGSKTGEMPPIEHYSAMGRVAGEGMSEIVVGHFAGHSSNCGTPYNKSISPIDIFIDGERRLSLKPGTTGTVAVADGRHIIHAEPEGGDKQVESEFEKLQKQRSAFRMFRYEKSSRILFEVSGSRVIFQTQHWLEYPKSIVDNGCKGSSSINTNKMINESNPLIFATKISKYGEISFDGSKREVMNVLNSSNEARIKSTESTLGSNANRFINAIKEACSGVINNMSEDAIIAVVQVSDDGLGITSLAINEIEFNLVSSARFTIVDRSMLHLIQEEQAFQMSGAVKDEDVVQIGNLSGANVVITGSITKADGANSVILKALDVKTGKIVTMGRASY